MKKVLITGGAGFLGSHLCKTFLKNNYKVECADNLGSGRIENIQELIKNPDFKFVETDITKNLNNLSKSDLILHFASRASPRDYQTNSFETMTANSIGTFNLLKKANKDKARFVFASTSEVYGQADEFPTPETYYGYVNSFGPRSCYDESKRFGESLCYEFIHKFGLDARIIRIFNTYGPNMKFNDGRVITNFIHQALNNEKLTIYGDGSQTRSFCYVSDLIKGIIKISELEDLNGEVINLGNPAEISIRALASKIISLTNSKSETVFKPLPKDDPIRRVPDISKAKKLLNWKPKIILEKGLNKTIKWFRK